MKTRKPLRLKWSDSLKKVDARIEADKVLVLERPGGRGQFRAIFTDENSFGQGETPESALADALGESTWRGPSFPSPREYEWAGDYLTIENFGRQSWAAHYNRYWNDDRPARFRAKGRSLHGVLRALYFKVISR
jgi:hypothetical protein